MPETLWHRRKVGTYSIPFKRRTAGRRKGREKWSLKDISFHLVTGEKMYRGKSITLLVSVIIWNCFIKTGWKPRRIWPSANFSQSSILVHSNTTFPKCCCYINSAILSLYTQKVCPMRFLSGKCVWDWDSPLLRSALFFMSRLIFVLFLFVVSLFVSLLGGGCQ